MVFMSKSGRECVNLDLLKYDKKYSPGTQFHSLALITLLSLPSYVLCCRVLFVS